MILKESIYLFFIGIAGSFIGTIVGGGGLITLPAMMIFGIPVHFGIGANKFSFVIGYLSNVIQILKGNLVSKKVLLTGTILGLIGGFAGGFVTSRIDEGILNIVVVFLLSFALIITMIKKPVEREDQSSLSNPSIIQKILTLLIGFYDGGFGPGSGTLSIMMFIHRGYKYIQSVHLTRMLIIGSCTGSLIVFWTSGFINWNYAIPLTMGTIIGAQIGFKALPKISQKVARIALMVITVLLIVQILIKIVL